jgi:hypothetical protein
MVKAITYIIKNDTTAGGLIGANEADDTKKVYPVIATQTEEYPLVTARQTARVPEYCRGQRPTTFNYEYEVTVYANDYDQAGEIAEAIIDAVEESSINAPINGVTFTDRIRNTNMVDADYLEEYKCYAKIITFAAPVYESQTT